MYKVLLVDDESWILKGLEGRINWEEHGFQVIGQALNGMEAFEKIVRLKPDLVFTDIRMPVMNGLELIKKVKDMQLNTQFVILSGYADFAYAQKAINYGAAGYCVKPFEEEEVVAILKKIRNNMNRSSYNLGIRLFEFLVNYNESNRSKVIEIFNESGLDWEKDGMLLLVSIGSGFLKFPHDTRSVSLNLGVDKKAYFLNFNDIAKVKILIKEEYPDNVKGVGISKRIGDIVDIKNAIEETETAACNYFISGLKSICEADARQYKELDEIILKLDEAIGSRDYSACGKLLDRISEKFHEGSLNVRHALHIYNMAMFFLFKSVSEAQEQYLDNYGQLIGMFGNINEMLVNLKEQITIKLIKHTIPDEIGSDVFKSILLFLNQNYNQEISLQSLSKEYFVSPSYITRLFRKELDQTFVEYLSKLRINKACELLKKSNLQIHEISEKVGYNDYFYFCRIFKRLTGKAPTQFRDEA